MKLKQLLALVNLNTIADNLKALAFAAILRGQIPQVLRRKAPAASSSVLATLHAISLPADAKAASILRATAIAGGTTGELTIKLFGVTPSSGEVTVAPNGDVVFLASDAFTSVDVVYAPERGDEWSATLPVASNVLTIPAPQVAQGVVLLAEVEALEGTSTGKKIVLVPGSGSPSAGQARLNAAKTTVTFASADAVTSARVTLVLCARQDLDALLEGETTTF